MPEPQAEVLAANQARLIDEKLATKQDLDELELALKCDTKELELALKRDIKTLELAFKHDMKELESRLTIRLGAIMVVGISIIDALVNFLL